MVLLTALTMPALAAPLEPVTHADFDHYTFALMWLPGTCSTGDGCLPDQPHTPLIGLHGLWASLPRDLRRKGVAEKMQWWAKGCAYYGTYEAPPALDPALQRRVEAVMPHFRDSLLTHEYDKHVACFGFDANEFFSTELAMRDAVVNSAFGRYLMQQTGHDVTHADVVRHFEGAFSTNRRATLQLQCHHAAGQAMLTQFSITIPTRELAAFPKPASFMDAPIDQDTCPAVFRIPAWPS